MTRGFSRHTVVRIALDRKVESWVRLHVECFEEAGGTPKALVSDQLKAAVIRAAFGVDDTTLLNRSSRRLARHYNFIFGPTPPHSPKKKGKIENAVRYLKSKCFKAHAPEGIRDTRSECSRWFAEVSGRR